MEKIRIAMAHRGAGLAPVFAAIEGGFFREQGLEPELVAYAGTSRFTRRAHRREGGFHQFGRALSSFSPINATRATR